MLYFCAKLPHNHINPHKLRINWPNRCSVNPCVYWFGLCGYLLQKSCDWSLSSWIKTLRLHSRAPTQCPAVAPAAPRCAPLITRLGPQRRAPSADFCPPGLSGADKTTCGGAAPTCSHQSLPKVCPSMCSAGLRRAQGSSCVWCRVSRTALVETAAVRGTARGTSR